MSIKKLLSVLLALVLILSLGIPAAAFDDIDAGNQALTSSTSLLSSLGIIDGYADGSFKPEKDVTRAEMAKMMVAALGYGDIANDTPRFTDCQEHWVKGYISLANHLGIIEGVGNNKFDPDSKVTYEQATAMLLRTLGYTNENLNGGRSTAYNSAVYKSKALSLGLYNDVAAFDMKAASTRGDTALMLNTTLQQEMVVTNENALPQGTGVALISKLAVLDHMCVTVKDLKDTHPVDLTPYLYQDIDVYKANNLVIYVVKSNTKTCIGTPGVNADGKLTVSSANTAAEVLNLAAASIPVFYNGSEVMMTEEQLKAIDSEVKFVLDGDGSVKAAVCDVYDAPAQVTQKYVSGKTSFNNIALPKDDNGKVDFSAFTVSGDATSLEDIKVGDVIECAIGANGLYKMIVTRNTVEGKITKISGGDYYINGTAYTLNGVEAPALGTEGVFYLDRHGRIAFIDVKEEAVNYALLTVIASIIGGDGKLCTEYTLVAPSGDTITLQTAPDAVIRVDVFNKQMVVEYSVDSSNRITRIARYSGSGIWLSTPSSVTSAHIVFSNNPNRQFRLSSDYSVLKPNGEGFSICDLADVKAIIGEEPVDAYLNNDGEIIFIVISPKRFYPETSVETTHYGLLIESWYDEESEQTHFMFAGQGGEPSLYTYNGNVEFDLISRSVIKYTMQNGTVTSVTPLESIEGSLSRSDMQVLFSDTPLPSSVLVFIDSSLSSADLPEGPCIAYFDGEALVAITIDS